MSTSRRSDVVAEAERILAAADLTGRIDRYLVRRGRPQTTNMLMFIFSAGERAAVTRALVELERAGKVIKSRAGWEATPVPA